MRTKNCSRDDFVLRFFFFFEEEGIETLIKRGGWRSGVASAMNCLWKAMTVSVWKGDDIDVKPHRRDGRDDEE